MKTYLGYASSEDNFGTVTLIQEVVNTASASVSSNWARYTYTVTLPSGAANGIHFVVFNGTGSGSVTTLYTGIQCELGATASNFEHRSFGGELSLCQRYYHQANFTAGPHYGGGALAMYCFNTTEAGGTTTFPVTMRAAPAVRTKDAAGNIGGIHRAALGNVTSGVAIGWSGNADANTKGFSGLIKNGAWGYGNLLIGGYEADAEI